MEGNTKTHQKILTFEHKIPSIKTANILINLDEKEVGITIFIIYILIVM
jgi:hypothetical protein